MIEIEAAPKLGQKIERYQSQAHVLQALDVKTKFEAQATIAGGALGGMIAGVVMRGATNPDLITVCLSAGVGGVIGALFLLGLMRHVLRRTWRSDDEPT